MAKNHDVGVSAAISSRRVWAGSMYFVLRVVPWAWVG